MAVLSTRMTGPPLRLLLPRAGLRGKPVLEAQRGAAAASAPCSSSAAATR